VPKFSEVAEPLKETCDERLQDLFHEVVKHWDCTVLEGHRDEKAQNEAFEKGRSKVKWPNGKHNSLPSCAVDVAPYPLEWDNYKRFLYFAGFVLGIAAMMGIPIRHGGDWNMNHDPSDERFVDMPHFEIHESASE